MSPARNSVTWTTPSESLRRIGYPLRWKTESIPDYLKHRLDMQGKYLEEIRATFGNQVLAQVPEMERDITGLPMIARMADLLCG